MKRARACRDCVGLGIAKPPNQPPDKPVFTVDTPALSDKQTLEATRRLVRQHLPLHADGYCCTTDTLTDALLAMAAKGQTLEAVCQDLERMPSAQTLRAYFNQALTPETLDLTECRLNRMLAQAIPDHVVERLQEQAHDVAIDLHDRPYYGKDEQDQALWVRAQAKAGTTRFHRVATAYLVRNGTRLTLALRFVRPGDTAAGLVEALVAQLEALSLAIRYVLLDKGFCSVEVMRYLARQGHAALIACAIRGKHGGTRALCRGRGSYRTRHTFGGKKGRFTAEVVVCRVFTTARRTGRMQRRGQWLLFVAIGCPLPPKKVRRLYARRFGVETSYRQAGQVRGWTTSRNAVYRFLLVGLSFVLLSVWTVLRFLVARVPVRDRRGRCGLPEAPFQLRRFTHFLERALERRYGDCRQIEILVPSTG